VEKKKNKKNGERGGKMERVALSLQKGKTKTKKFKLPANARRKRKQTPRRRGKEGVIVAEAEPIVQLKKGPWPWTPKTRVLFGLRNIYYIFEF